MLISILGDSLCVSSLFINLYTSRNDLFITILNKIDFIFLLAWSTCLFIYTFSVLHKTDEDFEKKRLIALRVSIPVSMVCVVIECVLPIDLVVVDILHSTAQGSAVNFTIVACLIYFFICVISILRNPKKINQHVWPVFVAVIITLIIAFLFTINPYLICISMGFTIVNLTMYFTIENPDLQMLGEVNEAKEEAQKANSAKTDFLSSMSHEIRTPLNAIVGFSECIMSDKTLEQAKEDAKVILTASDNLLEIVNGILDISKIEAGKMEIVNKEYDLLNVANTLAKMMNVRIGDRPIKLITHFSPDIPGVLFGDEAKVRQITTNLLTNAVKYTEHGTIDFTIDCKNEGSTSHLTISVQDTGRGIKEEQMGSLFDKFARLDEDRNSAIEGTGLGLPITQKMIELLEGQINVTSTYGEGSTFTVTVDQSIKSLERHEFTRDTQITVSYPGKKVLIVDDTLTNIIIEKRLLGLFNLKPDDAASGAECIDKCSGKKYDLILLDDMMPEMTGSQTLEILRKNPDFNTPVVVLTANAIEGMKDAYYEKGFDDYLAKPMDRLELSRVLDRFLGEHSD